LALVKEGAVKNSGHATNTLIKSTVTGMILNVPVKEGNSVIESNTFNEGTTIASVADMGSMLFIGNVDESEVGKINKGMDIILTIGAIADEEFKASLEYISPKGIEVDGAIQFEIRASVELKDSVFIRAGYSGNANIVLDKRIDVWAVDESTLNFRDHKTFVEIEVDTQIFEERFIETGLSDGINIEVLSGIEENDRIKLPGQIGTFKGKSRRRH
ncbi:MAG: efflux RND transporter periplasmic adaptor subunit, partial [Bacteroidetes bacterium]|nr:efflux RND transporter periplasmic adaptor subunit [Bacteroidota bacterium]